MICFPNAKINLGLHVTGRRGDGYHTIETVFYPVGLRDAVEAVVSEDGGDCFASLAMTGEDEVEENLVMKAYRLLGGQYQLPPLQIYLRKAIPVGAGLGGGSADAAFTLKLINELCLLNLTDEELERQAAKLGADCPFFIRNKPVIATGTGNVFTPIDLSLKGYHICIVKPPVSVSTKEAYSLVQPRKADFALSDLATTPVSAWRTCLRNDFEAYIFEKYPIIEKIKSMLYEQGAEYASMTGSGSAVYGLFRTAPSISLVAQNCFVWSGEM